LKSLRKLGRKDRERISAAIKKLPNGDVKRLRGPSVFGDYASASGA
jgi:mRNA-degrading endonuclease RelE of RelBE toxin-antitoxin system